MTAVEGRAGDWRVERLDWDETPSAVLTPVVEVAVLDAPEDWRGEGGGAATVGVPFLMLLDLPPLPGEEADGRPVVAAAAEPWTPMALHGGGSVDSLTQRAVVETPATVGTLAAPLRPGVVGRWDGTGDPIEVDPRRFRVRVLDGAVVRRVWEVEGLAAVYGGAEAGVDFPDGVSSARVAVAQWGEAFGWGAEAVAPLMPPI